MKLKVLLSLLCVVPSLVVAQSAGDPLGTPKSGSSTLDLLADMAASAPARAASSATDRKDSRERLLESLKRQEPSAAASSPASSLRAEALAAMASTRMDAMTDRSKPPDESQPFQAPQTRALQPSSAPDRIIDVAEDSWIRTASRFVRENRTWVVTGVLLTLAMGWVASWLFSRSGRAGRSLGGYAAGSGAAELPSKAMKAAKLPPPAVTRPIRRPHRGRR